MLQNLKSIIRNSAIYGPVKDLANLLKRTSNANFPDDAINYEYINIGKKNYKSIAIVACYLKESVLPYYLLKYIDYLSTKFDGIILISDSPILKTQIKLLENKIIYGLFRRHNQYDFGSYKLGYLFLKNNNLIGNLDRLLLTNDSIFGPIFNMDSIFTDMNNRNYDFWGLVNSTDIKLHIQSWFLMINKKILQTNVLEKFLCKVKKQKSAWDVVLKYEVELSIFLESKGFASGVYIDSRKNFKEKNEMTGNLMLYPYTFISKIKFPFIKIKAFSEYTQYVDQRRDTLNYLRKLSNEYFFIIYDYLIYNNFDTSFYLKERNDLDAKEITEIASLKNELHLIKQSRTWKTGKFFANLYHIFIKHNHNKVQLEKKYLYKSAYQDDIDFSSFKSKVRTFAFYLPQYHTFKENDTWWGKGFTEWTNVKKSTPRFKNHYQPRAPHKDIGYYCLKNVSTLKQQAEMLRKHNINGLIFYYYWFSGKELMETPLNLLLKNPEINLNFCLCWANENWTRAWDGENKKILIKQEYNIIDAVNFIRQISKYLKDKRYIKINNKSVIFIYNPYKIPNLTEMIHLWRKTAKQMGLGDLYIVTRNLMFSNKATINAADAEFDFPPVNHAFHWCFVKATKQYYLYDYENTVTSICSYIKNDLHDKPYFYTSTMGWDNSSRRKYKCFIFNNYNLKSFYDWNKAIVDKALTNKKEERILLVNAWNEWCEGTYLEPDEKYGYANINTLSKAVCNLPFIEPLKLNNVKQKEPPNKKIAVQIHMYYIDLADEFIRATNYIKHNFDIFITTDNEYKKKYLCNIFKLKSRASNIHIDVVKNRGRDIAPFIMQMKKYWRNYDFLCHIHTKKSKFAKYGKNWRHYLLKNLFGDADNLEKIFYSLSNDDNLGMLYPPPYKEISSQTNGFGGNYIICKRILKKLGISRNLLNDYFIFPSGSMFWAKSDAIKPLFSRKIHKYNFPKERGQINATYAHGIERVLSLIAKSQGYTSKYYINKK
ncbi:MAG: glycoside hydrolase family 99-like domain-containing protein [Bacilli bacterium]|nr:glycoside hydrolase family 99-like domain-containing protein [Bacilli bacterium]